MATTMTTKMVFTTLEVADICKVSIGLVARWFDSGRLKGNKIPCTQNRLVPREYLVTFMKSYGISLDGLS